MAMKLRPARNSSVVQSLRSGAGGSGDPEVLLWYGRRGRRSGMFPDSPGGQDRSSPLDSGRRIKIDDPLLQDQIAAARAYEELHVPALFQQWCVPMLEAAQIESGHRVLDVACGTGVLVREAGARVGPTGFAAGVDPDPGMLAVAEQLAPTVEWRQGAAESLPYPDQAFDAVVCQFGLMFFADRRQALREMLRVLTPLGTLAVAVWDRLEHSDAYPIEVDLLERLAGQPAADALRAPFVLGNKEEVTALFQSAGVASVRIVTRNGTARFPSIRSMVEADLRGWLPVMSSISCKKRKALWTATSLREGRSSSTRRGTSSREPGGRSCHGSAIQTRPMKLTIACGVRSSSACHYTDSLVTST